MLRKIPADNCSNNAARAEVSAGACCPFSYLQPLVVPHKQGQDWRDAALQGQSLHCFPFLARLLRGGFPALSGHVQQPAQAALHWEQKDRA